MTVAVANFLTLPSDETQAPAATSEAVCRDGADVALLVRQAQAGDAAAFGRLVTLHERAVFRATLAALRFARHAFGRSAVDNRRWLL